jgi:hexosaminidase
LNTDWGDYGHWQHLPTSFLGFAYGAAVSWAVHANQKLDLPHVLDVHVFQDDAEVMGQLAFDLGEAYKKTGVLISYRSALAWLLLDLAQPMTGGRLEGLTREALENTLDYVDRVMAKISEARMNRPDSALISDEFRNAAAFLRHACRLGIARFDAEGHEIAQIPLRSRQVLAEDLQQIIEEYQHVWLARNRPGGLDDSSGRIGELVNAYRT